MQIRVKRVSVAMCALLVMMLFTSFLYTPTTIDKDQNVIDSEMESPFVVSDVSPPSVLWNDTFGGSGTDYFYDIIVCSNGDYLGVGWYYSNATYGWDGWMVRLNESHDIVWERTYGGLAVDTFSYVVELSNGDFVLAGSTKRVDNDGDFWLFRTNSSGYYNYDGSQWNTTFGGGARERIFGLVQTPDDGFAMSGETLSYGHGGADGWLVKVDSTGSHVWDQTYGTSESELFYGMTLCDGGFAMTGLAFGVYTIGVDGYIVRTDSSGNEIWNNTIGFSSNDYLDAIVLADDGGFIVAGEARISGNYRYWLAHTNSTGHMTKYKLWYGGATAELRDMIKLSDGGYVLTGDTGTAPTTDLWVLRANADLEFVWDIHVGETSDDSGWAVAQNADGVIVIAGLTDNYGAAATDGWILEISNPLSWVNEPIDQIIEVGDSFSYDANASSFVGIDDWWLNDTSSFSIDSTGVITNSVSLTVGNYPLRVFVNDTTGDYLDANITISVQDTVFPGMVNNSHRPRNRGWRSIPVSD